jgi:ORF6N domain-containing protein
MSNKAEIVPEEIIASKIYLLRKQKVMLDKDLAELYGVETRVLVQAVKRNIDRFPSDFMFQLEKEEFENLISQIVTSSWGGTRKMPYAFTEQGVAMLSSVLRSKRAIQINIHIMRVYTKLREMLLTHKDLLVKMNELESKVTNHDKSIKQVFAYLKEFVKQKSEPIEPVGFKQKKK